MNPKAAGHQEAAANLAFSICWMGLNPPLRAAYKANPAAQATKIPTMNINPPWWGSLFVLCSWGNV